MKIDTIQNGTNDVSVADAVAAYSNAHQGTAQPTTYFGQSNVSNATRVLVANGSDIDAAIIKFGPEGNTGGNGRGSAPMPKNIIGSLKLPKYGYVIIDKEPDERLCAGFYANGVWENAGEARKLDVTMIPVAK